MTDPTTFEGAVHAVMSELEVLMVSKHRDYSSANIMEFGELGVLMRANDKMARLKNLVPAGKTPNHEGIEDSWMDLANYGVIALMLRRGWFTLPLSEDVA